MFSGWRQLQLFEAVPLASEPYGRVAATKSFLVAVDGVQVRVEGPQLVPVLSFMAYDPDYRVTTIRGVPNTDLVVTVAEKQGFPAVVKVWDVQRLVGLEADLQHKYLTQVLVHCGDNAHPITCVDFNDALTCMAVGYANGKVVVVRGDLRRDRGAKQRLVYESTDPVTGVHLHSALDLAYVTTTGRILTVSTAGRNQGKPTRILSKKTGAPVSCSVLDPETHELIVATDSGFRFYSHLTKTHSLNFEIRKKLVYRFRHFIVVVSPDTRSTRVLVIDLFNKHVAFSMSLGVSSVDQAFELWGDLHLLSTDGVLYRVHEKPANEQVELVLQRDLFTVAYQLATQAALPPDSLLRILKLHAQHLYDRQNFDEAVAVYVNCLQFFKDQSVDETVGDFAMAVITKFKDASNINFLTEFLYQLYKLSLANSDHITLLLCCYCKLKLLDKLNSFIKDLDLESSESELQNLNFPLLINLFKECGYFNEVISLLFKLNQPNLIVGIQLNDLKKPQVCLEYIQTLPIDELLLILIDHSKTLLDNLPIGTTQLLINVFTGKYSPAENDDVIHSKKESVLEEEEPSVLNSYKGFLAYLAGQTADDDDATITSQANSEPTYLPPKPSLIFPSFINNPNEFVIFLEACIESFDKYQGSVNDKKDLLITLLEMYLTLSRNEQDHKEEWFSKSRGLLNTYPDLLESSSVLILSHIFDFKDGEIASKEQGGYEETVFRMAQSGGDVDGCFDVVRKYGDTKPELYKLLMKFIVSSQEVFDKVNQKDFKYVLNKIKTLKLATPLEIVQILGSTEFATIGLLKDYLIDIIDTTNQEVANNEKLIDLYEKESTKNSHLITELTTKPFIMQSNRCSSCNQKLDVPVIHFKCKHSFHQRCLNSDFMVANESLNAGPVCALCINDLDSVKTLRADQLKSKDETELFDATLRDAPDKFKVVATYLGKGVMENEFVGLTQ